jgi:2-iminoacetate synthase
MDAAAQLPDWTAEFDHADLLAAASFSEAEVRRALAHEEPGLRELAALLSPDAAAWLEPMAKRAEALTRSHFGRTISLYAPLYLANYCINRCTYCGYAADRRVVRHRLEVDEMEQEFAALRELGFEDLLLLTGERTPQADFAYLREAVARAAAYFHGVSVETFPMSRDEYHQLALAGCTGVTLYQETYIADRYAALHVAGPKRDYLNRLNAPDRALEGGLRTAGIGVLLGLSDPRRDVLRLYLHARYLLKKYWRSGLTLSMPRVRPQTGGFIPDHPVDDRQLAQIAFALRLVFPDVPLVLSTREDAAFRDGMAGVGISRMSVASRTTVGGYASDDHPDTGQFDISDDRDVATFCAALKRKGLEPVFKNVDAAYRESAGG